MKRIFLFLFFLISTSIFAQPNYTLDSIVVVISNDTVYVWDYNAWEQCGFQLDYTVEVIDSVITITQIDTAEDGTTCYGYHNFVVPVVGLIDGNYRIDIFRDCLCEDIKFIKSFWFEYLINSIADVEGQPNQFALYNAYPNPFNPTTIICYSLKENSLVSLEIYNIKGQKVKTLVNSKKEKGEWTVFWNGKDESGSSVCSGIYFYRLKTGNFIQTKRMTLLK